MKLTSHLSRSITLEENYFVKNLGPMWANVFFLEQSLDSGILQKAINDLIEINPYLKRRITANKPKGWILQFPNINEVYKKSVFDDQVSHWVNGLDKEFSSEVPLKIFDFISTYDSVLFKVVQCQININNVKRIILIIEMHHALMDGIALLELSRNIFKQYEKINNHYFAKHIKNIINPIVPTNPNFISENENYKILKFPLIKIKNRTNILKCTVNQLVVSAAMCSLSNTVYNNRDCLISIPINKRNIANNKRENLDEMELKLDSGRILIPSLLIFKNTGSARLYYEKHLYVDNNMPTPDFCITNMGNLDTYFNDLKIYSSISFFCFMRLSRSPWPGIACYSLKDHLYIEIITPESFCDCKQLTQFSDGLNNLMQNEEDIINYES
jgi:hypothetical protein